MIDLRQPNVRKAFLIGRRAAVERCQRELTQQLELAKAEVAQRLERIRAEHELEVELLRQEMAELKSALREAIFSDGLSRNALRQWQPGTAPH